MLKPLTAWLSCAWPCDVDLWFSDLEQLSYIAGHVANPAAKFEDPTAIRSWVTCYNGSRWLPLKMRTRWLHMRRITWPVSRGSKTITFLESPTSICLSLYNFYWDTTTIKSRLHSRRPVLKPFSGEKNQSPVEMVPKNDGFREKWGSKP